MYFHKLFLPSSCQLVPLCIVFLLSACSSTPPAPPTTSPEPVVIESEEAPRDLVDQYLTLAADTSDAEATRYRLLASRRALEQGEPARAETILAELEAGSITTLDQRADAGLQRAALALAQNNAAYALVVLNGQPFDRPDQLPDDRRLEMMHLRAEALLAMEQHMAAVRELSRMTTRLPPEDVRAHNNRIWQILSAAPLAQLQAPGRVVDSYELRGWLELVNMINTSQNNLEQQTEVIAEWQSRWAQHSAAEELPDALSFVVQLLQNRPARIALILPLGDAAGQAVSDGFLAAYYEAGRHAQPVPEVVLFDSTGVQDIQPLYQRAVESGPDLIIGPLQKDAVRQLQSMPVLPVPTLALNYGDAGGINPSSLYQFGLAPEDEIQQAARIAWQAGHRYAAVLTPAGEEYRRIQDSFISTWEALGGVVVSRGEFAGQGSYSGVVRDLLSIDASEARMISLRNTLPRSNIHFTPRRRQDVDFVFMLANPSEGRQLKPTFAFHFSGDLPIYAMPAVYDGVRGSSANRDLSGIVFVDAPWLLTDNDPLKAEAEAVWPSASAPVQRLRAMGADAFRLHLRLAQLANFPGLSVQGATGVLSMRPDGTIARELLTAEFIDGQVELHGMEADEATTALQSRSSVNSRAANPVTVQPDTAQIIDETRRSQGERGAT